MLKEFNLSRTMFSFWNERNFIYPSDFHFLHRYTRAPCSSRQPDHALFFLKAVLNSYVTSMVLTGLRIN